ncbi:TetR/AcrR family transcriptional regulator [Streptomyces sp. Edi4]|uniref:TetR/AcrR family transcriptional regulator n=1 Tax=Streptomyces sp. Edi4 TaxID=3162527 RepID=UPI0033055C4A
MSPRKADPEVSANLIVTAARILKEEGPGALSTRRLAAAVGTSTTAVYTHFGGMDDLVKAVVHEGFRRLNDRMTEVSQTDDPVADVAALGYAYRANALEHQHLYSVMFGGASLGGFALSDDERQHGRYTLETLVAAVTRCMEAGRFRSDDPARVAHQMWIGVHGLVTLELGGYLIEPYDADTCFQTLVCGMLVGAGDDGARAATAMDVALGRQKERTAPAS